MAKLISALALSFISVVVVGCAVETEPGDVGQDEVAGEEIAGDENASEDIAGEEDVAETSAAIQYGEWNGSCADSLTLRGSPGGNYICGYQMSYGTALHPYHSDGGAWAYVYVGSGLCWGMTGWVLKDYVSRNCLL